MPYSAQVLHDALAKVRENNASIRAASIEFNIPYTTLYRRLYGAESHQESHEHIQLLSRVQEEHLAKWILAQHALGASPTHAQIKTRALHIHQEQQPHEKPPRIGRHWIHRFFSRNPTVKPKRSRRMGSKRGNKLNKPPNNMSKTTEE